MELFSETSVNRTQAAMQTEYLWKCDMQKLRAFSDQSEISVYIMPNNPVEMEASKRGNSQALNVADTTFTAGVGTTLSENMMKRIWWARGEFVGGGHCWEGTEQRILHPGRLWNEEGRMWLNLFSRSPEACGVRLSIKNM